MQKINKFLQDNIINILIVFLLSQPLLDVTTSICINYFDLNFTIGMVARFLFMALATYYVFFVSDNKLNKKSKIYLTVVVAYILIFIAYFALQNTHLMIYEFKNILKVFYLIFILVFLYTIKDKLNKLEFKYLNITFLIYLGFIFIPNLFGGFNSYDEIKIGKKGLFNSANEVGAIISLLYPIFLYSMLKAKKKLPYIIVTIIYIYTILTMGTKVPVFAFAITLGIFMLYFFINIIKSKNKAFIIMALLSILLILGSVIYTLPKTPFYKNIKTHMEYFEINSIKDVFNNIDNFDNIIFSQRISLTQNNLKLIPKGNIWTFSMGNGYYDYIDNYVVERKIAEIDYIDLFVSYGLIGFILYFIPIIIITKKYLKTKLGDKKPLYIALYFLIFLIALFSGHVFTAPAVSFYASVLLGFSIVPSRKLKGVKNEKV